ncbi:hypothetical protein ACU8OG_26600 (plasmid) [Rhizobium leguminosarum]
MRGTRYGGNQFFRRSFPIHLVFSCILMLLTYAAMAKADEGQSSPRNSFTYAVSSPGLSEESFRALIKARDAKLVLATELKQINSYHDKLRVGLDKLLNALSGIYANTYTKVINDELNRLGIFEKELDAKGEINAKQNLSMNYFSRNFPVLLSESEVVSNAIPSADGNPITFASREYIGANAIFENVSSFENKEFANDYRKIFDAMQSFGSSDEKWPLAGSMPATFLTLAGANSYDTLTESQVKLAVSKYRDVLEATLDDISASKVSSKTTFIVNLRNQAEQVSKDLVLRSSYLNKETDDLEGDVASTAKSLYGHAVSETSFYILLTLFAVVFITVMVAPKFYTPEVAKNILTSDFILQFSTVFVLIAAIIILSIGGFIASDQVPVLLAGISGYVLGQLGANQRQSSLSASDKT